MEEQLNAAAKEFLITVASELACKGTCFISEQKECRKDILRLKRSEAKHPVISCGAVEEHPSVFITAN